MVTCIQSTEVYEFPCQRWLDRDEEDGAIERDLYVNGEPGPGLVEYRILTVTVRLNPFARAVCFRRLACLRLCLCLCLCVYVCVCVFLCCVRVYVGVCVCVCVCPCVVYVCVCVGVCVLLCCATVSGLYFWTCFQHLLQVHRPPPRLCRSTPPPLFLLPMQPRRGAGIGARERDRRQRVHHAGGRGCGADPG